MILLPVSIIVGCLLVQGDIPADAVKTEVSQTGCKVYFMEDVSQPV